MLFPTLFLFNDSHVINTPENLSPLPYPHLPITTTETKASLRPLALVGVRLAPTGAQQVVLILSLPLVFLHRVRVAGVILFPPVSLDRLPG